MPDESNKPLSKEEQSIDEAALDWVIMQDSGFSPEDQDAFFEWLATDPRHGEYIARHQRKWKRLDHLVQWRPEHSDEANPYLIVGKRRNVPKLAWISSLAAAAAIALFFLLFTTFTESISRSNGILPVSGTMASAYQWYKLEDGSIVELNKGAQVEYRFDKQERRLYLLSGEAHFIVAKNAERPFIVNARGTQLKAIGTAFNVNLTDDTLEVSVTHGIVEVAGPIATQNEADTPVAIHDILPRLTAGNRSIISLTANSITPVTDELSEIALEEILAWKHQKLEFEAAPLHRIVESFNRYNPISISIQDPEIENMSLTAKFRSDNIEGFLRLLELTMPIEVIEQKDGDYLLTNRS